MIVIGDSITWQSADRIDCAEVIDAVPGRTSDGHIYDMDAGAVAAITRYEYSGGRWIIAIGTNDLHTLGSLDDARQRIDAMYNATGGTGEVFFVTVKHYGEPLAELRWNTALYLHPDIGVIRWEPAPEQVPDRIHPSDEGERMFADAICSSA